MVNALLIAAVILILCVLINKLSFKIGMPMLLGFIVLGMVFGVDGLFGISFENYVLSEQICTVSLIFIMFYGGFGTNWSEARPIAVKALVLSSLGVILTAVLTGAFCYLFLRIGLWESFLIGAIISSTDAASVFSILRSKKLGLKENTASLLELESGSNDPCSYMLTVIVLSIMGGSSDGGALFYLIFSQVVYGLIFGALISFVVIYFLRHFNFGSAGFDMTFFIGVAVVSYALPAAVGGNGYLSAYIVGIALGNVKMKNKASVVNFFDGLTSLMQILIFFLLGLLATPTRIISILPTAIAITLFLTLAARPAAVFAILTPMRCSLRQQLLVSFAGLRGAASIVFAIMATVNAATTHSDVYHIVFCIVLFSLVVQGTLLPAVSHRLGMCDKSIDILKTFSDYSAESDLHFIKVQIPERHSWNGKKIKDVFLPPDTLIVMLLREHHQIVPAGNTVLLAGDTAVLSARSFDESEDLVLTEQIITADSPWIGRPISEFSPNIGELVIMILRHKRAVIPRGDTKIFEDDVLVIGAQEEQAQE